MALGVSLQTHYETLGVGRSASPEQVRTAYRRRAQSCHPDKAEGQAQAQASMTRINQAYAVLGDPPGRAAYDRWLEAQEVLQAAERAVWEADHPGARAAWPWVVLSATIAFSMVTVGTVVYREMVPLVVVPPTATRADASENRPRPAPSQPASGAAAPVGPGAGSQDKPR